MQQTQQIYYAHSGTSEDQSDWQLLREHLINVAHLAAERAKAFGAQDWAYLVGVLHDLGKYSKPFQERLHGSKKRAEHATAGAKIVIEHITRMHEKNAVPFAKLLAFAIAGHHTGLANGVDDGQGRSTLEQRLACAFGKDIPALDDLWKQETALPLGTALPNLKAGKHANFGLAFFARMLFSCLIDADRLDTQNHARKTEGKTPLQTDYPTLEVLQKELSTHLQSLTSQARPSDVNILRKSILNHSREQAGLKPGLFSLTVPTGGGKTLTSLAFGLDHAMQHGLRRVIYVIPFTSIIEQTAKVFRHALGEYGKAAVLEHHSAFDRDKLPQEHPECFRKQPPDYKDKLRLSMESWNAPIVVTTAVQFFESLFADRPSQCRKLHNIAGSVIILDEAQTLPLKLLRPIMAAIDELALNYRCTVVLCTATQPALKAEPACKIEKGFHKGFECVREIAPNPEHLFQKLQRTCVHWLGEQNDNQLIEYLKSHEQVLMIVNNRRHARVLYDAIAQEAGAYHLTTTMCAEHRSKKLGEIRQCLTEDRPCRLVATSLIEAGVDVDFPTVYRAEAGLDSIAQAAGRCNREGKRSAQQSQVFIFQSPDWKAPAELAQLAAPMREILRNHKGDVFAPDAMKYYFQSVYHAKSSGTEDELDSQKILKQHRETEQCDFPFQNIASRFRMIKSHMLPVLVPFNDQAKDALRALEYAEFVGGIARQLQRYVVQVPKHAFAALLKAGAIEAVQPERFGGQFYVLSNRNLYNDHAGLDWDDPSFIVAESAVM